MVLTKDTLVLIIDADDWGRSERAETFTGPWGSRQCFEGVGGYIPVAGGGIDVIEVLTARRKGWRARTFTEEIGTHHRLMGSAKERRKFLVDFASGQEDYRLGFHPVWQPCRVAYQTTRKPYLIGGLALLMGYFWAMLLRTERPLTPELVALQRCDQMRRLRAFVSARFNALFARSSGVDATSGGSAISSVAPDSRL